MSKLGYVGTLLSELIDFARKERIYWIVPLLVLLLVAAILVFTSQAATPFIYTLF